MQCAHTLTNISCSHERRLRTDRNRQLRSSSIVRAVTLCLTLSFVILQNGSTDGREPLFRLHVINGESTYSAAAAMDVNGDGITDIVCGGFWYEAPSWQPRFLRTVEEIRGRFDDYSNLTLDVNGDGYTDLISVNYRSQSLYWVENPGTEAISAAVDSSPSEWSRHVIDTPGAMETGRLYDIDGDGRLDVLPNGVGFAAWWDLTPGPTPEWKRFPLPRELAGHGIGFGDINGDGRGDVVGPRGWAEAPADRRTGRWQFHPEFHLWQDASIPILVADVDQDGDNDIIWGRGHHFGVYWLEQSTTEDGDRRWIPHAIDTSWSQAHSLLWADLDGDGHPELICGSRHLGHDGKDPGEFFPHRVCSYQFLPESGTWKRSVLSSHPRVGFGLDPKVVDIDGDGDLDLVCPGRSGLYLLENLRIENRTAPEQDSVAKAQMMNTESLDPFSMEIKADTYRHTDVLYLRQADGTERPIVTPFEMGLRRQHIHAGMSLAMGNLPESDRRVPLDIQILGEESADGYLRRRISFSVEPDDRVPAWLLIPDSALTGVQSNSAKRHPAMLCLHQTTGIGKGEPAGLGGLRNLHYAHELAQRGFVCLVPDYPSFGDYAYDFQTQGKDYVSGSMKAIWNNIRAIDLLESLSEVNPDRIGCIGHSLGGHNTLFTAAFDGRIRAAVTSCGFTAFHHYYAGNLAGWTSDRYMPRIRDFYGNDPNRMPFDFYEVLAAIAPRSIFINAPVSDDNFDVIGVRKVVAEVENVQAIYGDHRGVITARYPECGHDFPEAIREEVYDWLKQQLGDTSR